MKTLVLFLEELSAKEMLQGVLSRLLPDSVDVKYFTFQGKQDLEKQLNRKLKYWLVPNTIFVVLRDQDAENCEEVKERLKKLCESSGKSDVLIRIACHELESFYLGDLQAVEKGLGVNGIASKQQKSKYRNPDDIKVPSEELIKLTKNRYQKVLGSKKIAPCLDLENNKSRSFIKLIDGIKRMVQ